MRRVRYQLRCTSYTFVESRSYFFDGHVTFPFYGRHVTDLILVMPAPPHPETNSKIRGTNFDAGGVKPYLSLPTHRVSPLFCRTHHRWKRHLYFSSTSRLSCFGVDGRENISLWQVASFHGDIWFHISRLNCSSSRKWPPSPPHLLPGDTNLQKVGVDSIDGVYPLV